jgi:hypothetical protein
MKTLGPLQCLIFRGSIPHPMQSLCTLRDHCRQWPRNTRYQAGAAPYLRRTSTGWIAPACLAHSFNHLVGALLKLQRHVEAKRSRCLQVDDEQLRRNCHPSCGAAEIVPWCALSAIWGQRLAQSGRSEIAIEHFAHVMRAIPRSNPVPARYRRFGRRKPSTAAARARNTLICAPAFAEACSGTLIRAMPSRSAWADAGFRR